MTAHSKCYAPFSQKIQKKRENLAPQPFVYFFFQLAAKIAPIHLYLKPIRFVDINIQNPIVAPCHT
jgi:hypothetical protein